MALIIILWVVLALLALAIIGYYNRFAVLANRIENSYSQIDVQLKKRADLVISNKILIEIKKIGLFYSKKDFENKRESHKKCVNKMKEKGFIEYLYITLEQSEEPKKLSSWNYREKDIEIFGKDNAFFLDESDDNWRKFVDRVGELLKENHKNIQN